MFSHGLSLNKEVDNWRTPCVRVLTKFIPESSPVKIWSVKPFRVEKSLNFLPLQFVLHDLINPGGNVEYWYCYGDFLNFIPMSLNITSVVSLRQSLVSHPVHSKGLISITATLVEFFSQHIELNVLVMIGLFSFIFYKSLWRNDNRNWNCLNKDFPVWYSRIRKGFIC